VSDLDVQGYVLNMDDGTHTDLLPVYVSDNKPNVRKFEVAELVMGLPYRF
jgi:hypothetical protein